MFSAVFAGAQVLGTVFAGAQVLGAFFAGALVVSAVFAGALVVSAVFAGAQVLGAVFAGAQLVSAVFAGAQVLSAVFAGAQVLGAVLAGAQVLGAAPVLLFRRRVKSVADVLKGIRQHGFSQGRWDALHRYWRAVCRQGPCWPLRPLEPWVNCIPLTCMASTSGFWMLWGYSMASFGRWW